MSRPNKIQRLYEMKILHMRLQDPRKQVGLTSQGLRNTALDLQDHITTLREEYELNDLDELMITEAEKTVNKTLEE